MTDQPKMKPPIGNMSHTAQAYLSPDDYRKYYEVVMTRGTSGSETIRQLIREEYDRLEDKQ